MNKLLTIREASKVLGVSESTLRRWEREKKLIPDERTKGNQRRYRLSSIAPLTNTIVNNFSSNEVVKNIVALIKILNIEKEVLKRLNDCSQD